jgi:hypothetical protein
MKGGPFLIVHGTSSLVNIHRRRAALATGYTER